MKRVSRRMLAAVGAAALALVLLPGAAWAFHGTSNILVGQDYLGNNAQRFHPGNKVMYVGQTATYSFAAGAHNVGIDTGSLPAGAGAFRSPQFAAGSSEPVGSTFAYSFTTPGTYNYYCSVHASQADSNGATYDANGEPSNGKMVGRIVVQADTSGPVWGAGAPTAAAVSASQIDLTWPAATDPETGIQEYRIFEATGATRPAKPASASATTSNTSLSRNGLTAGQHYWYWITAVNGAGSASSTDQLTDATTSSVAASATATGVVKFAVNSTLSISVSPGVLDLGTVSPGAAATGQQIVNVKSNDPWSLSMKSVGRNGTDEGPGDDAFFTDGTKTIPIGRMTWSASGGPATAVSDTDATLLTGQARTTAAGADTPVSLSLLVDYSDPPGADYQTVLLYTATQP